MRDQRGTEPDLDDEHRDQDGAGEARGDDRRAQERPPLRVIAALVMGAVMALVMLGFMWSMYEPKHTKIAVVVGAALLGVALLSLNREQSLITDVTFMKAMIRTSRSPSTTPLLVEVRLDEPSGASAFLRRIS